MSLRNFLMVVSLALSVAIGLVIARGGGGPAKQGNKIVIGLSMDTLQEARWQVDRDVIAKRCRELGADLRVLAANSDDVQQTHDVESLLTQGAQALIIIPHDTVAMAKAVELAHERGVPVISYDRLIRDSDVDLWAGFDNFKVGQLQGQFLIDHLPTPGKGRIVRIYGAKTDSNSREFKDGQDKALEPYIRRGDIEVIHEDWAENWTPGNAKKITNAAITRFGPNFDAVLASNDGTAGGAIQALTEAGVAGKVLVTGQDAELAACQRIVAGTQAMSVYKPLSVLGAAAADAAVAMAQGKPIVATRSANNGRRDVPAQLNDVVALTKDNMVETVVRDKFQNFDDIYRGVPDDRRPPRP